MRILQVASEAFGLVKTGGLADVTAGLSSALVETGHDVRLVLPAYRGCLEAAKATPRFELGSFGDSGPVRVCEGRLPGTDVVTWLVDAPLRFDRPGGPYLDVDGHDYADNPQRFGLLGRVAALLAMGGALAGWRPDVVHAHDWQAALSLAHLAWWGAPRPKTVFTIHNLHFQGRYAPGDVQDLGLPAVAFATEGLELYGTVSFIKAGLQYADRITTVSPSYAREICEPTGGEGLDGLLRHRGDALRGILNGIDRDVWNPRTDRAIEATFGPSEWSARAKNKHALQAAVGLQTDVDTPLFGAVSRLAWQKGIDLLLAAAPSVIERGGQIVVVGSGDPHLEAQLSDAAARWPGRFAFFCGYDEPLSHRVFAGSDMIAVPSRFEPCGLTQLYALRYGALPIVRATGGLRDTVLDASHPDGVGFVFEGLEPASATDAMLRGLSTYADRGKWRQMQLRAMARDHGWPQVAGAYAQLYDE